MTKRLKGNLLLTALAITSLALLFNTPLNLDKTSSMNVSSYKDIMGFKMPVSHSGGSY